MRVYLEVHSQKARVVYAVNVVRAVVCGRAHFMLYRNATPYVEYQKNRVLWWHIVKKKTKYCTYG